MADNLVANPGVGGASFRTLQDTDGKHWPGNSIAYATTLADGANVLQVVTPAFPFPVTIASSALPTGAATAARQDTGNNSLGSIDAKLPALGQALAAASVPVVLTAAQIATLTPFASVAATQSGTWTVELGATDNGVLDAIAASLATLDNIVAGNEAQVDVITLPALVAGAAVIGKVGIDQTTPGTTNAVQDIPGTSGGLTMHKTVSAASTNATSVKGSAGQVYEIMASNVNAAARYLKLYDKATAPTVGTDTPKWTLIIPGNTAGGGIAKSIPKGLEFTLGIAFALTTEATDAGTTGVAANELVVNLGYK